mgnify:CR=1 FL=1
MNRRTAIRTAVVTACAGAFGRLDLFAAKHTTGDLSSARTIPTGGMITVDLGQWQYLVFDYQGKRIVLTTREVFAALEEGYGSGPTRPTIAGRK